MIHARADYQRIQDPAGKIPADEPVMLFRAQDVFSPALLVKYVELLQFAGAQRIMIDSVVAHEAKMRAWQLAKRCHIPDMPAEAAGPLAARYVRSKKHLDNLLLVIRQTPGEILIEYNNGERVWMPLDAIEPAHCCSDCKMKLGEQHRPSCHRQGLVTADSDYNTPAQK